MKPLVIMSKVVAYIINNDTVEVWIMYDVTEEDILYYFDYDRESGELYWKRHQQRSLVGRVAGSKTKNSTNYTHHRVICCSSLFGRDKEVKTHRIIYFLEHGKWLKKIDHIDGNGLNNHYTNLRDGTGVNNRNTVRRKPRKDSKGLPQGVYQHYSKRKGLWIYVSRGTFDGVVEELYRGSDLFEAAASRKSWENDMIRLDRFTKRHFGRE